MTGKRIIVVDGEPRRAIALEAVRTVPLGYVVTLAEKTRTNAQNAAQWPILEAFAEQLLWPVNGKFVKMTSEEWKDVLTAAFRNETTRLAMGLDGGVVMLGMRTSNMSKKMFGEWLEFLHSVADDRGVKIEAQVLPNL